MKWADKSKIQLLEYALIELKKHCFWGKTPNSVDCFEDIIEDYKRKIEEQHD